MAISKKSKGKLIPSAATQGYQRTPRFKPQPGYQALLGSATHATWYGNFLNQRDTGRENSLSEDSSGPWIANSMPLCFSDLVANFICGGLSCAFPSSLLIDCTCKTIVFT